MFKISSSEEELYRSMQNKMCSNQLENKYSFDKISRAADYLNSAASIFDQAGMKKEAAEITEVLSDLAKQISSK